jgi:hypothetical protein
MADLRPSLAPLLRAFGVAATVTPPGGAPIATTVIALAGGDAEYPAGGELTVTEHHRVLAVRRDEVPTTPSGTVIVLLEGADAGSYIVDSVLTQDAEVTKVLVR